VTDPTSETAGGPALSSRLDGSVLHVVMGRAPVNAVDGPFYAEIHDTFTSVDERWPEANAIVVSSSVRHFCAGNDLGEFTTMTSANARERMFGVREAFFAIQDCAVPVVAAVHGAALGTGLAIAASCDIVVASDDAFFGLPEITVGVMGGACHLARLVPQPVVREMFFTGRPVPAAELWRIGGISRVVARDELLESASALAADIARHSPTALRVAKHALNRVENMELQPGYAYEQSWTCWMADHPDSKEAIRAGREDRAPVYAPAAFSRPNPASAAP
jgi:enoyl-CoA hydratase